MDITDLENHNIFDKIGKNEDLWWVIISLDVSGPSPKLLVYATGDSNLESLRSTLRDDAISFIYVRCDGIDRKGSVVSNRRKFIFYQYVGPNVKKTTVAKVSGAKAKLNHCFSTHVSIDTFDKSSIDAADIEARLRASGGAHQPDEYVFGTGSKVDIHYTPNAEPDTARSVSSPSPSPAAPSPLSSSSSSNNMFAAFSEQRAVQSNSPTFSTQSTSSPVVKSPVASANNVKTVDEVTAAVKAIGKAAKSLEDLINSSIDGKVSVADIKALVAGDLSAAALRSASALSVSK